MATIYRIEFDDAFYTLTYGININTPPVPCLTESLRVCSLVNENAFLKACIRELCKYVQCSEEHIKEPLKPFEYSQEACDMIRAGVAESPSRDYAYISEEILYL